MNHTFVCAFNGHEFHVRHLAEKCSLDCFNIPDTCPMHTCTCGLTLPNGRPMGCVMEGHDDYQPTPDGQ